MFYFGSTATEKIKTSPVGGEKLVDKKEKKEMKKKNLPQIIKNGGGKSDAKKEAKREVCGAAGAEPRRSRAEDNTDAQRLFSSKDSGVVGAKVTAPLPGSGAPRRQEGGRKE